MPWYKYQDSLIPAAASGFESYLVASTGTPGSVRRVMPLVQSYLLVPAHQLESIVYPAISVNVTTILASSGNSAPSPETAGDQDPDAPSERVIYWARHLLVPTAGLTGSSGVPYVALTHDWAGTQSESRGQVAVTTSGDTLEVWLGVAWDNWSFEWEVGSIIVGCNTLLNVT